MLLSVSEHLMSVPYHQANTVYRLGNWELSRLFRDAPDSTAYSALSFGGWILELKGHLQDKISGTSKARRYSTGMGCGPF